MPFQGLVGLLCLLHRILEPLQQNQASTGHLCVECLVTFQVPPPRLDTRAAQGSTGFPVPSGARHKAPWEREKSSLHQMRKKEKRLKGNASAQKERKWPLHILRCRPYLQDRCLMFHKNQCVRTYPHEWLLQPRWFAVLHAWNRGE